MGKVKAGLSLGSRKAQKPAVYQKAAAEPIVVEKIVEKYIEVPVEIEKEVRIEVPYEVIVEKVKEVPVEKIVEVVKEVKVPSVVYVDKPVKVDNSVELALIDELSNKIKHLEDRKPQKVTPKWVYPVISCLTAIIIAIILIK